MKKALVMVGMLVMTGFAMAKHEIAVDVHDDNKIRQQFANLQTAMNKKDAKAISMLFTADGDLVTPAGVSGKGRAQVEKVVQGDLNTILAGGKNTIKVDSIRFLATDVAVVNATHMIGEGKSAMKVMLTCVCQKQNNEWLCAVARPMVPATPPAGPKQYRKTERM